MGCVDLTTKSTFLDNHLISSYINSIITFPFTLLSESSEKALCASVN